MKHSNRFKHLKFWDAPKGFFSIGARARMK